MFLLLGKLHFSKTGCQEGGKGEGGGGGQDHVSRKIEWSFHKLREIKSAFHVSRKKGHFFLHELT